MEKVLVLDVMNLIHRAYHALPKTFTDKNGEPINAVYGFTSMLISSLEALKPTYVIAALDSTHIAPTFRDAKLKSYKATRKETDPELIAQIPKIEKTLEAFNVQQIIAPSYEADDIIGTIASLGKKEKFETIIISNDKDVLQLLSNNTHVYLPGNSKEKGSFFGIIEFRKKYGFEPINMIDYKALRGDASDNITGVAGIGEKGAEELIKEFKTIENLYKNIEKVKQKSLKEKLIKGEDSAFLSKEIATIVCDVPIEFEKKLKVSNMNGGKVFDLLTEFNFKSLMKRMGFKEEGDWIPHQVRDDGRRVRDDKHKVQHDNQPSML